AEQATVDVGVVEAGSDIAACRQRHERTGALRRRRRGIGARGRFALVELRRQRPRPRDERHRRAPAIAERDPDRYVPILVLVLRDLVLLATARDDRDADHSKTQRVPHRAIVNEELASVELMPAGDRIDRVEGTSTQKPLARARPCLTSRTRSPRGS